MRNQPCPNVETETGASVTMFSAKLPNTWGFRSLGSCNPFVRGIKLSWEAELGHSPACWQKGRLLPPPGMTHKASGLILTDVLGCSYSRHHAHLFIFPEVLVISCNGQCEIILCYNNLLVKKKFRVSGRLLRRWKRFSGVPVLHSDTLRILSYRKKAILKMNNKQGPIV